MLKHRVQGLWNAYHAVLILIISVLFWGQLRIMDSLVLEDRGYSYEKYVTYYIAAVAGLLAAAVRNRSKAGKILSSTVGSHLQTGMHQTGYVVGAILLVVVASKDLVISRLFLFTFAATLFLVLCLAHRAVPRMLIRSFFRRYAFQRTLLLGSAIKAREMNQWFRETAAFGIGTNPDEAESDGDLLHFPKVEDLQAIEGIVRQYQVRQIFLLEMPSNQTTLPGIIAAANKFGSRLFVMNNLAEIFNHPIVNFSLFGVDLISLRDEPLQDPINRMIKRALDLCISLPVVLFLLPPLCLLVWLGQMMQSRGPLFYRQTRAGVDNMPFRIFKFRTMYADGRGTGKQASHNDSRIYRFGRFLRKSSLDEIPQFINVLMGDMSIVGPRPHMIIHNRKFSEIMEAYHVRSLVKPGITGLAQTKGYRGEAKTEQDIVSRAKLDIAYIESWSLPRDVQIILETAKQVFVPPPSAY